MSEGSVKAATISQENSRLKYFPKYFWKWFQFRKNSICLNMWSYWSEIDWMQSLQLSQRGEKLSIFSADCPLQLYMCVCVGLCKYTKYTSHSKLLLSEVNLLSDSCTFRVLPWWQAGVLWQKRLMCVHACVFPVCELKGAAAKHRLK